MPTSKAPAAHPTREQDEFWMRQALEWSARGKGWTSPRPSVGCVLVRDGELIGGGHTQPGDGQPHAEVMALRAAAEAFPEQKSVGATAYVTLEPCSHWGTTPPCCDALLREGVIRVVVGIKDPNPLVAGRGLRRMHEEGVEVLEGVLADECRRTHEDFLKHIVSGRPFVTLKSAMSLDGKIALSSGESKWITGTAARERGHLLRHQSDVVAVGIETVLADDPQLSVRLEGRWKQPARLVLDGQARLPLEGRIWQDAPQLLVAVGPDAAESRLKALEQNGATILRVGRDNNGHLDWEQILSELYARRLCSILIEGGARVAGSALAAGIVDKVVLFQAPILIGAGREALSGFEVPNLGQAPRLWDVQVERVGEDIMLTGYLGEPPAPAR